MRAHDPTPSRSLVLYCRLMVWITRRILAQCTTWEYWNDVARPVNLELVMGMWVSSVDYYASPMRARVLRLWFMGRWGSPWAYTPLRVLAALGLIRCNAGYLFQQSWWSYPLSPVGVQGWVRPWEMRVLAWCLYSQELGQRVHPPLWLRDWAIRRYGIIGRN